MSSAHPDRLPPTDLELMMLADGELDPARVAEIEAYLADEDEGAAHGKLSGLRAVSAVVSSAGAWPERGGIDVVDGVFAQLDRDAGRAADVAPGREAPASPRSVDRASTQNRPTLDGAASSRRSGSVAPAPANDNARLIFGLALGAAAAAAALFVWGRGGDGDPAVQATRAPIVESAGVPDVPPAMAASPGTAGPSSTGSAGPAADEPRYGVEVASVDFGQRSGAIYYVPAGDAAAPGDPGVATAAVTTVVWLSDE